MAERPLLALPRPTRGHPRSGNPPRENVPSASPTRQSAKLGPTFARLQQALPNPASLEELRGDPYSIAPERALVFEVAGSLTDFYRALRALPGLELLGEDEFDVPASLSQSQHIPCDPESIHFSPWPDLCPSRKGALTHQGHGSSLFKLFCPASQDKACQGLKILCSNERVC